MLLPSKRKRGRERLERRQHARAADADAANDNNNPTMVLFHQWSFDEEGGHVKIVHHILSFLDVTELVEKKQVCKKWQELCTQAIDNKCPTPKNFKTNKELRDAVKEYCSNMPKKIEKIAKTYGYPINKWIVIELEDFSCVFYDMFDFNEDISSWDLSNAKNMSHMFYYAVSFNPPLPWNTSNVTNMRFLFCGARSFNQPLSWNTSNVTDIAYLFCFADAFNQPMDSWDTSKIVHMRGAFAYATSFNQSLTNWVFHNDVDTHEMLHQATSYDQELPASLNPDVVFSG